MLIHYLLVFLISMVPLIELRGAIPYAIGFKLDLLTSYIVAIVGNMLPVPFIFFFARKVLEWGDKKCKIKFFSKFCHWCIKKGIQAKDKLKSDKKGVYIALLLFVGIPLPGTGAWTGTLAASFLDLDFKKSVVAVCLGIILAGIIMGLLSSGIFGAISLFA